MLDRYDTFLYDVLYRLYGWKYHRWGLGTGIGNNDLSLGL